MENRKINIFSNEKYTSVQTRKRLKQKLETSGFVVPHEFDDEAELIICIGGDGSLLQTLQEYDFPNKPIVGVNTGHLGFFQELHPGELDEFIFKYKNGQFKIQQLKTVSAEIITENETFYARGLNEIVVKGIGSHAAHFNMFIGDSFIEKFSGDGLLIATPAGSTAYNYALGGSIVDPRLDLLQVTPIAPINNSAYRSFTSSVLLPPHLSIKLFPEFTDKEDAVIVTDGYEEQYRGVKSIHVGFAEEMVHLVRFEGYDFWNKVKQKLL